MIFLSCATLSIKVNFSRYYVSSSSIFIIVVLVFFGASNATKKHFGKNHLEKFIRIE